MFRRNSRFGHAPFLRSGALALGVLMLGAAMGAAQQESRELYLEVFINGQPVNLIARFVDLGGGAVLADAQELENTGILPDAAGKSGDIRVDRLPGVTFVINEADQTVQFTATEDALATRIIPASEPLPDTSEDPIDGGFGVVLNYGLSVEAAKSGASWTGFGVGDFDARMFTPFGALSHSFTYAGQQGGGSATYRRLETFWRSALPRRALQVQIGDITTRGPSWVRPARLGGILIERNFELRPDLLTLPLPSFEGSAAVPSTVEVYSGSIRQFSADVPAGPFALTDLPFGTGSGLAQVVVRDVTGRETRIDLPFLVSADLMRKGVADYALAFGKPRLGIGTDSDHYGDDLFGVATLRFGLTNGVTLAAHLEGGKDLQVAGVGATFRIGTLGTATVSAAQSRSSLGTGALAEVSGQLTFGRLRVSGRVMRTNGTFSDIARASADPGLDPSAFAPITGLNQLSLTLPMITRQGGAASLFYADIWRADGPRDKSLGISYAQPVFKDSTLNLTVLAVQGETSDVVFGLGLQVPLGKRLYASADLEHRGGHFQQTVSASGQPADDLHGWNWRIQATRDAQTSVQASAGRNFRYGEVEGAMRLAGAQQSIGLRVQGAVVAAGGGIFLSGRIDDAFAVVDAGAPGVEVQFENRPAGATGGGGKLLVPGLRSYDSNTLSIDPASLPLDADIASTRESIRPALRSGVKVDFGITTSPASAMIELLSPDGEPLDVGLSAVLNGGGESYLIGYDGMVYALGLQPQNEMIVRRADGSACRAEFAYQDEPGTMTQIERVICQ